MIEFPPRTNNWVYAPIFNLKCFFNCNQITFIHIFYAFFCFFFNLSLLDMDPHSECEYIREKMNADLCGSGYRAQYQTITMATPHTSACSWSWSSWMAWSRSMLIFTSPPTCQHQQRFMNVQRLQKKRATRNRLKCGVSDTDPDRSGFFADPDPDCTPGSWSILVVCFKFFKKLTKMYTNPLTQFPQQTFYVLYRYVWQILCLFNNLMRYKTLNEVLWIRFEGTWSK